MQFFLYFWYEGEPAELVGMIAAYFEECGYPCRETPEPGLVCGKLWIDVDMDPEDAQSRREYAEEMQAVYGVRQNFEMNGQLYSSCSETEFAAFIRWLQAKLPGDFFLGSEWEECILYRISGAPPQIVSEEWQPYF